MTCRFCVFLPAFTSAAEESAGSDIGLIVGAVIAVLVVAAAVIVGIVLYRKYKARIKPNDHSDEEKAPPPGKKWSTWWEIVI